MKSRILSIIIFISACLMLLMLRSEVLILAEDRNDLAANPETWADMIQQPMGILSWTGCWLTQLCYYPALGALAIAAILAISFALICRKLNLSGWRTAWAAIPAVCILWYIHGLGYWMYCMRMSGCLFAHALAIMTIAAAMQIPAKYKIIRALLPLLLYPAMGFWAVALGIMPVFQNGRLQNAGTAISTLLAAMAPIIWWVACYSKFLGFSDIYTAGLTHLINDDITSRIHNLPLIIAAVALVSVEFFSQLMANKYIPTSAAVILLIITVIAGQHGDSFAQEIRMARAAENADWNTVKKVARAADGHTESMRVLYDLAMAQTGTIGGEAFATNHKIIENEECTSVKASAIYVAAWIAHYYYGRYNITTRWCIELGVKYGFGTGYLRMLARAAKANGEPALCQKYTNIIRQSMFYANWQPAEPNQITKDFHCGLTNRQETDHNLYEYLKYSISLPENIATQTSAEMAMYFAMRERNKAMFLQVMAADTVLIHPLPRHHQEACVMFADTAQSRVSDDVRRGFGEFTNYINQLEHTQNKELIKPIHQQFGKTYWWYVYFEK